jgi:hypothetical protein
VRVSSDMLSMKLVSKLKYQIDTAEVNCDGNSERAFLYGHRLPLCVNRVSLDLD